MTQTVHNRWSSRLVFILAATGSAVGLGNIWKFPYILGENGGGAFMLVYLGFIIMIGLPVLILELTLGKMGRLTPGQGMAKVAQKAGRSRAWGLIGWMGLITGFLILTYYSVIAGWTLPYTAYAANGAFGDGSPETIGAVFGGLLANPSSMILYTSLLLVATVFIIGRGLKQGLEKAVNFMMPGLAVILGIMLCYGMVAGDFASAISFMFKPDFSKLTAEAVIVALGHAFFTLSLAAGAIMMYGSYLPEETSIARSAVWIVIADTAVALVAGMAIFPLVFANGLEPSAGPGLLFVTLPIAFAQMPFGDIVGPLFFIMLVFAAFTSIISLIEAAVAWLVDHYGFTRWQASASVGSAIWVLSLGTVYSFAGAEWANLSFTGMTIFDSVDYLTSNVTMPLGGLLMSLFVGWRLSREEIQQTLKMDPRWFTVWVVLIRYLAPLAITLVFLNAIGLL